MDNNNYIRLDQQLCFSLYAASREVIKLYKPVLDKFDLTYTQYITMLVIWEEKKISVKGIGHKLHLDSGTLTPLLKKLEQRGLVTRYRDKNDDRVVIVELTAEGEALRAEMMEVPERIFCQVGLEVDEAIALKAQLDKLINNLTERSN